MEREEQPIYDSYPRRMKMSLSLSRSYHNRTLDFVLTVVVDTNFSNCLSRKSFETKLNVNALFFPRKILSQNTKRSIKCEELENAFRAKNRPSISFADLFNLQFLPSITCNRNHTETSIMITQGERTNLYTLYSGKYQEN